MRETIVLTIACMCLTIGANAQRDSGRLPLSTGLLYKNGLDMTLVYEHEMNYRHARGFSTNGYLQWAECESYKRVRPKSFWQNYRTYSFDVAYKPCVMKGHNHYGSLRIGASGGNDTRKFLVGLYFGYEHNYMLRVD